MYAEDEVIGGEEERSVSGEALVWGMEQCEGRRPGESGEENQIRPKLDGMRRREGKDVGQTESSPPSSVESPFSSVSPLAVIKL